MKLEILRDPRTDCTLGELTGDDLELRTIEEAWRPDPDGPGGQKRDGALIESCVPDGDYEVVPHDSAKFPNSYALVAPHLGVYRWPADIPANQPYGRSAILIHAGNTTKDIMGCIAVGLQHGFMGTEPAVLFSRAAFDLLRSALKRDTHTLTIRTVIGSLVTK